MSSKDEEAKIPEEVESFQTFAQEMVVSSGQKELFSELELTPSKLKDFHAMLPHHVYGPFQMENNN